MDKEAWKDLVIEDAKSVADRTVIELERDLAAADRAAATAHREMRACELNFHYHLERVRFFLVEIEKKKDRRRAASRELGHPGKRKR
jgi:hypothetical protein